MITLTNNAVQHLKKTNLSGLRISVTGGGCSGLSYKLQIEEAPEKDDQVFEQDGIKIIVDPRSFLFIKGLTLDYINDLNKQGFLFSNPNAQKGCGCGNSFGV